MTIVAHELKASYAFIERNFFLTRRYWGWELAFLVYSVAGALSISLIGASQGNEELLLSLMIGAIFWNYLSVVFSWIAETITIERWEGTLEYTMMAPIQRWSQLLGSVVYAMVYGLIHTSVIFIALVLFFPQLDLSGANPATVVAFMLLGGWNSTYYEASRTNGTAAQNYDGYVGQAELKFYLLSAPGDTSATTGLSAIAVGFTRDLSNSYLGAFYTRDRGYLGFDVFLGGVFFANIQGGFARYSYPQVDTTLNPLGFTQNHIDAQLFTEYRFNDNLGLNFTLLYDKAIGEGPYPQGVLLDPNTNPPTYDNLEYERVQAYVGLRLFW